jgi:DNA-binding NarL/FixJ family response regulator
VISVLLVDDYSLIRMGFRLVLDAEDDIEVIGAAPRRRAYGRPDARS